MEIANIIEKCSIKTLKQTLFIIMNYFKRYVMLKPVKIIPKNMLLVIKSSFTETQLTSFNQIVTILLID